MDIRQPPYKGVVYNMRQLPEGKADDEPRLLRPGTESPLQIPLQPLLPITLVRITKDVDGGSK